MSFINEQLKRTFTIDITTTNFCNFRCHYCYEGNATVDTGKFNASKKDQLYTFIDKLLVDDWFVEKFDDLNISFWGGEPTQNLQFIFDVVERYKEHDNISFFIFTNGYDIKELIAYLKSQTLKIRKKFSIQVSYDGKPIHNKRRVCKMNPAPTAETVLANFKRLSKVRGINLGTKSTAMFSDIDMLEECWDDFKQLSEQYPKKKIKYSLTMDSRHASLVDLKHIREVFIKIIKKEIAFFKEHKRFLSNLLDEARDTYCSAGMAAIAINVEGEIFYCHGCLYSNGALKPFSSIYDEHFIDKAKKNFDYFEVGNAINNNIECQSCEAMLCLRCSSEKFSYSKKESLYDRWYDNTTQPGLCNFYKELGKISRSAHDKLGKLFPKNEKEDKI